MIVCVARHRGICTTVSYVYLSVVELPVNVDLALCDVASQVRDGMSDVIVRHSQNRNLCDGSIPALNTTGSLRREGRKEGGMEGRGRERGVERERVRVRDVERKRERETKCSTPLNVDMCV